MTTDLSGQDMGKIVMLAKMNDEEYGARNRHRDKSNARLRYLADLFQSCRKGWSWCKKKSKKCKFPTEVRICDLAIVYRVRDRAEVGNRPWMIPVLMCEISSGGSDQKDCYAKLAREMAHCLAFVPTTFGMIVNILEKTVALYEFNRDPLNSYIDVYEKTLLLHDTERKPTSIGKDLVTFVRKIAKCVLYTWMIDLPRIIPGLASLSQNQSALMPTIPDYPIGVLCDTCWHIDSIENLDKKRMKKKYPAD